MSNQHEVTYTPKFAKHYKNHTATVAICTRGQWSKNAYIMRVLECHNKYPDSTIQIVLQHDGKSAKEIYLKLKEQLSTYVPHIPVEFLVGDEMCRTLPAATFAWYNHQ